MKTTTRMKRSLFGAALLLASACFTSVASAGTYQTSTLVGDFVGIAPSYTATSTVGPFDFSSVQITNDSSYIYVNVTFSTAVNPDDGSASGYLYEGVDTDNDTTTGYDLAGSGIGSDLGEDPFGAFAETSSSFNAGGLPGADDALVVNYDTSTTDQIIEIPLTALQLDGVTPYFTPGSTIGLLLYDDANGSDSTPDISYTLATAASSAPEPKTWMLMMGALGLLFVVARRRLARVW